MWAWKRGEQLSWGGFGKGLTAGRLGALEEIAMWIDYFPHHCDPMLDRKAMYGRKGLFCLWFEGAESIMAGRGQSQGCRSASLGLLASRQTEKWRGEDDDAACLLSLFFIQFMGPSPQDGASHLQVVFHLS